MATSEEVLRETNSIATRLYLLRHKRFTLSNFYYTEVRWFDPSWCQWIFHKVLPIALCP